MKIQWSYWIACCIGLNVISRYHRSMMIEWYGQKNSLETSLNCRQLKNWFLVLESMKAMSYDLITENLENGIIWKKRELALFCFDIQSTADCERCFFLCGIWFYLKEWMCRVRFCWKNGLQQKWHLFSCNPGILFFLLYL